MPRHRLRDAAWASLHAKLVALPGIWKRDPEALRRFIEAVVYILRTGVAREDLPERFGEPNSVYIAGSGAGRSGGSGTSCASTASRPTRSRR